MKKCHDILACRLHSVVDVRPLPAYSHSSHTTAACASGLSFQAPSLEVWGSSILQGACGSERHSTERTQSQQAMQPESSSVQPMVLNKQARSSSGSFRRLSYMFQKEVWHSSSLLGSFPHKWPPVTDWTPRSVQVRPANVHPAPLMPSSWGGSYPGPLLLGLTQGRQRECLSRTGA